MRRSLQPSGFTLVELLVSMAIALVLILGINAVFSTTAKTVGSGQSLLSAGRDARTFLRTMYIDMQPGVIDPVATPPYNNGDPVCFLIQSSHVYAFRNFDDQQSAANQATPWQDATLFPTGSPWPASPLNTAPVPLVHFRSHRIDKLGFFARGLFARQTSSNANSFTSSTTSNEAWILYEHASQPNKALIANSPTGGAWLTPGAPSSLGPSNDYNYFGADWMLARLAIALVPTPSTVDKPYLQDNGGLTPLTTTAASIASAAIPNELPNQQPLWTSRLDIAQTSIEIFESPFRANGLASYAIPPNYGQDWFDQMIGTRIQASPYLLTPTASTTAPKLDPYGLATAAPCLIRGCTQFIVEYAGNYYTKDPNGYIPNTNTPSNAYPPDGRALNPQRPAVLDINNNVVTPAVTSPVPDPNGTLDYYIDASGNRHIRWYGFPRLVLLSNTISTVPTVDATYGNPAYSTAAPNSAVDAVVPLRDVLDSLTPTGVTPTWGAMNPNPNLVVPAALYASAERFSSSPAFPPSGSNYWQAMSPTTDSQTPYVYTAAWGPDSTQPFPKMIRIVICIDDHEGRLSQPQFYEYVFDVQQ